MIGVLTANVAGTNGLTCLLKHGAERSYNRSIYIYETKQFNKNNSKIHALAIKANTN
jgi:hypothetical protein